MVGCMELKVELPITWDAKEGNFKSMKSTSFFGKETVFKLEMKNGHLIYNDVDYGECAEGSKVKVSENALFIDGKEVEPLDENGSNH